MLKRTSWMMIALLAVACEESPTLELTPGNPPEWPGPTLDSGVAICDQAPDGTPCGLDMHCIFNACVRNACGDGVAVAAAGEACDDGNQRDHDGCSSRCKVEPEPGCGNQKLEPGEECDEGPEGTAACTAACTKAFCGDRLVSPPEECDDGNTADGDACDGTCRLPCGNGVLDPGEACDDGNRNDGDGCDPRCKLPTTDLDGGSVADGGTSVDAGMDASTDAGASADASADAGSALDGASSADASADAGSVLDGGSSADASADAGSVPDGGSDGGDVADGGELDAGVLDAGADAGTAHPWGIAHGDPACAACREQVCSFYQGQADLIAGCFQNDNPVDNQLCIDVINCAYLNDCAYGPDGLNVCFCGTADVGSGACQAAGAANGPCMDEMYAAAKTHTLAELIGNIGYLGLPIGRAYFLMACDVESCPACVP